MNYAKLLFALLLIGGAIIAAIFTEGISVPFSLPLLAFGLQNLGVEL